MGTRDIRYWREVVKAGMSRETGGIGENGRVLVWKLSAVETFWNP